MEQLQTILESNGLTPKESEVYLAMLKLGESPVSDIIKETKTHPQIIYRAIEGLADKQLALIEYRRHRMYVRAEDPRVLEDQEQERVKQLHHIIPELLSLQQITPDAIVRVAKGNEAVRDLRVKGYSTLKEGETYYIMGASGRRFYEVMGKYHLEIERMRVKRGVRKKIMSFESQRQLISEQELVNKYVEYRYLPEKFPTPTSTNIYADVTAIIIWAKTPIVITVESKEVAESNKNYFETLWKMAKK